VLSERVEQDVEERRQPLLEGEVVVVRRGVDQQAVLVDRQVVVGGTQFVDPFEVGVEDRLIDPRPVADRPFGEDGCVVPLQGEGGLYELFAVGKGVGVNDGNGENFRASRLSNCSRAAPERVPCFLQTSSIDSAPGGSEQGGMGISLREYYL